MSNLKFSESDMVATALKKDLAVKSEGTFPISDRGSLLFEYRAEPCSLLTKDISAVIVAASRRASEHGIVLSAVNSNCLGLIDDIAEGLEQVRNFASDYASRHRITLSDPNPNCLENN